MALRAANTKSSVGVARSTTAVGHRPNYLMTILVVCLIAIGMIMLYSTGSIVKLSLTAGVSDKNTYFTSQLFSLTLGAIGWYIAVKLDYHRWQKWAPYIFYTSLALMLLVMVPGFSQATNGATRWIRLGIVSFQPVEFFKLGLVLYLASWLEKNKNHLGSFVEGLLPYLFILGVAGALAMVLQRDMGSAMVLLLSGLSILLVSTMPLALFATALGSLAAGGILMIFIFPYRLARLTTFFKHTEDVTGAGYHINQALIAIGSGGIFGRGLGQGLQAYGYLPESTNDSIFAIIGEQFGLWGCMLVIGLFTGVIYHGLKIARLAADSFGRSLAIGITAWIGFQALINIAAMLGVIPLTGIPLPFVSFGGTSLIATLVAIGILQNVSKFTYKEDAYATGRSGRGNRRTYIANSGDARRVTAAR